MKKFICIILSTIVFSSVLLMGGCSDFSFNPIGKWEFSDNIYSNTSEGNIFSYKMSYIFEKSGTGYITANDDRTKVTFTYEYDNENVYITFDPINNESSETQTFVLSKDQKQLTNSQTLESTDENGNTITSEWTRVLTRE